MLPSVVFKSAFMQTASTAQPKKVSCRDETLSAAHQQGLLRAGGKNVKGREQPHCVWNGIFYTKTQQPKKCFKIYMN